MEHENNHITFVELMTQLRDRRLFWVFLLGFASGFPWVLIGSNMSGWLKDAGLDRATIGYFGSVFGVYAINFLWAPLVDRLHIPVLTTRLGQRRSWLLLCQIMMLICTVAISYTNPAANAVVVSLWAMGIALSSATQDILTAAFRIDIIGKQEERKVPAAAAMEVCGWWAGFSLPGFFAFLNADAIGWPAVFRWLSLFIVVFIVITLFVLKEPHTDREARQRQLEEAMLKNLSIRDGLGTQRLLAWLGVIFGLPVTAFFVISGKLFQSSLSLWIWPLLLLICAIWLRRLAGASPNGGAAEPTKADKFIAWMQVTVVEPFAEFFRRNGVSLAIAILSFIFLFKVGEAFLGRMAVVFYKEIGFDNADIGWYQKAFGGITTIFFTLMGLIINMRFGVMRGLFIGGVAMAASNLMFALIAVVGPSVPLFAATIFVDNFTAAFATIAFVSFLTWMTGRAFSATQYALLASIGTAGRTILAAFSGQLVDSMDGNWAMFFVFTALAVVPSLLILRYLSTRLRFD